MTHHELTVENKELKEQTMTDMQKDLMKKLLGILFMDWEEEWQKEGYESSLTCTMQGCSCDGGKKIRNMFGTDELEELYSILEQMHE